MLSDDIVERLRTVGCPKGEIQSCGYCLSCIAADEIKRLRSLIIKFVDAEHEYQVDYQDAYNGPDDSASVLIKDEWRNSWTALRAESELIKETHGE